MTPLFPRFEAFVERHRTFFSRSFAVLAVFNAVGCVAHAIDRNFGLMLLTGGNALMSWLMWSANRDD